jgi:uncharacterized membrane protein YqjE
MDPEHYERVQDRGLRGSTARLSAALLGLARSRLELASIEFAEERDRLLQQVVLVLAAVAMFMFAVLFVATWVIVYFWDTNRLTAIAIVAVIFAGLGAILMSVRAQAARAAPTPFAATLAELERDRAGLAAGTQTEIKAPPAL